MNYQTNRSNNDFVILPILLSWLLFIETVYLDLSLILNHQMFSYLKVAYFRFSVLLVDQGWDSLWCVIVVVINRESSLSFLPSKLKLRKRIFFGYLHNAILFKATRWVLQWLWLFFLIRIGIHRSMQALEDRERLIMLFRALRLELSEQSWREVLSIGRNWVWRTCRWCLFGVISWVCSVLKDLESLVNDKHDSKTKNKWSSHVSVDQLCSIFWFLTTLALL